MKEATYISFEAKSGKDKNLATFLTKSATIVAQTEPSTLFSGKVAAALDGTAKLRIDKFEAQS